MAQYLGECTALAEGLTSVPRTYSGWFTTFWTPASSGIHEPLCSQCVCMPRTHMHTHTELTVKYIHIGTGSWMMGHGILHIYFYNAVRVYTYFKIKALKKQTQESKIITMYLYLKIYHC